MADEVANLLVRITADGSQATGVLNGVASTVTTLADKNASLMNKISATGQLAGKVGSTITKTFGVATVAGIVASAKAASQLNKELANIGTLSVPTERLKEFKGDIQDIAIATAKSTSDISEGTYQVISAFGDAPDTMEKVEINAKAATAGLATTADSIALTSAVTKAYGDTSAAATQHVADLAFKTVELGQTTFPELAQNMQQVTSLSKELGVSQEELFGTYATLTGVTGNAAEVQTQLKAVYTAMLKPSENMAAVIEKQGYASGYAMIKSLGFAGTLNSLKKATNGSEEEMLGLFNNVRAMPAVMALTGAQADTFTTKLGKMEEASGAATKAFEVQTEGVAKTGFTLEQAKVKMQVAAQHFGESAAPVIGDFADIVDKAATSLANLSDEQRESIINTGLIITKLGLVLSIGRKVLTLGSKLAETLKTIGAILGGGSIDTFGNWAAMGSSLGPLAAGLAIPAAVVGGYAIISKEVGKALDNNAKLGQSYEETYGKLKSAEDNAKYISALREEYKRLNDEIGSGDLTPEQLESAKQRINEIMQEIKSLVDDNTIKLMIDTGDYETALAMAADKAEDAVQEIENNLQINNNDKMRDAVSKAYEGISGWQGGNGALQKRQEKEDMSEWLRQADIYKQKYRELYEAKERVYNSKDSTSADRNKAWQDLQNYRTEMMNSDFAKKYKSLGFGDFNFNDTDSTLQNFTNQMDNVKNKYTELDSSMNDMFKRAEDGRKSIQAMGNVAIESSLRLFNFDDIQSAINAGGDSLEAVKTNMVLTMQDWGMSTEDISARMALFENGFMDLQSAINNNSLDAVIADFIQYAQSVGMSADQITMKAALMKNGFSDVHQALEKGDISGVVNDLGELGGNMGMTVVQVDNLARSMGLIPEDKHIEFTANGYEVVEGALEKLKSLETENVSVSVDENGVLSVLNQATGKLQELNDIGAVSLELNAEGNIDVLNEAGEKVAEIKNDPSATITVDTTSDTEKAEEKIEGLNNEPVKVTVDADIQAADTKIKGLSQSVDVTVNYTATGAVPKAKGDSNFAGGNALLNDDNSADPRELIMHDGLAYMYNQPNVIANVPPHATILTSSQTKAWFRKRGITSYASGKNNSDAFTAAKDDWTHYTKTHAVTTAQELQKWLEFQEKYKDNEKDIWDIEEQIFSLQNKLYSERVSESEKWLAHEEKYHGLSAADYMAGIDRMKAYTEQYYADGIISHKEYTDAMLDLDEKYIDKRKEQLEEMYNISKDYISEHTYFNDWQDSGDDPLAAYNRVMERNREALAKGELTQKEYDEYAKNLGSDMFSERKEQSLSWLEEQRKYFGMTDAEYVEGLERIKTYTQEYYDKGLISRREYNEAMTELDHSMWDEALSAYDDMLQKQQDYISEMREQFQKEEQALQDSWAVADRKTDISQVQAQLDIYAGAVTDRGQQKYKELEEQMKQLQRDEELYNLQVRNNATIEGLEADYKTLEENKKNILNDLRAADINISGYVENLSKNISLSSGNISRTLSDIIDAIHEIKVEQSYYNDNSQTTINAADNVDIMAATKKKVGSY